jgi:hypothetical protein
MCQNYSSALVLTVCWGVGAVIRCRPQNRGRAAVLTDLFYKLNYSGSSKAVAYMFKPGRAVLLRRRRCGSNALPWNGYFNL